MILKIFYITIFILIGCLKAQIPDTIWTKIYGGNESDHTYDIEQTIDDGYIVCGTTNSFGNGESDIWLLKLNALGDTIWTKIYGGSQYDSGRDILLANDSGFVVIGYTYSFGNGESDIWLLKINETGDTLWTKTFGGIESDYAYSVIQNTDGGYLIGGTSLYPGQLGSDIWLIKTDLNGDSIWTKRFGYSDSLEENCSDVINTNDGGYIIAGNTAGFTSPLSDVWIIKTNSFGDTLWSKYYGGSSFDWCTDIQQTADGGIIVTGFTDSFGSGGTDVWLFKIDETGNIVWDKVWGGTDNEENYSVSQTDDGGYIIAGLTQSIGVGWSDGWLIKTNSLGDTLWTKTFEIFGQDKLTSVKQTDDGGYILSGDTFIPNKFYDFWILKLDGLFVRSPNGGEYWRIGQTKKISWLSNNINEIKIEYTINSGLNWLEVINNIPADSGSYNWLIPNTPSEECRIRVSDVSNPTFFDESDSNFTIKDNSFTFIPDTTYLSGELGDELVFNIPIHNISSDTLTICIVRELNNLPPDWTSAMAFSTLLFPPYLDSIATTPTFLEEPILPGDTQEFSLHVFPINTEGTAYIRLRAADVFDLTDTAIVSLTAEVIDYNNTLLLLNPNGGENYVVGNNYNIYWVYQNVTELRIEYTTDDGLNWHTIIDNFPAYNDYYNWTVPNTPSNQCKVKITSLLNPNTYDESDSTFSILNPKQISVLKPNGGEIWMIDSTNNITWTSDSVQYVSIKVSIDSGSTWLSITDSTLSSGLYAWLVNIPNTSSQCLVKITDLTDSTIYDTSDSLFTIERITEINNQKAIISNFHLYQNHPNPFNPITKIKFNIPNQSQIYNRLVTLKVYNILGREVATLVNEEKPAGEDEVEFDGSDLPSGIYFYQLKAGDFIQTKKMVLIK